MDIEKLEKNLKVLADKTRLLILNKLQMENIAVVI
jgi:DNA-binding transcriptional ArsR family regulator